MEPVGHHNTVESMRAFVFVADASDLGILAGVEWPGRLEAEPNFGNGQPLINVSVTHEVATYAQSLGCITLKVFND